MMLAALKWEIYPAEKAPKDRCWQILDIAPTAAIGVKPDVRNFSRMAGLSALLPLVLSAANGNFEPFLHDAASRSNGRNKRQTGRLVSASYAYS